MYLIDNNLQFVLEFGPTFASGVLHLEIFLNSVVFLHPCLLVSLKHNVSDLTGLEPQHDDVSPSALGELSCDGLSCLQLCGFGELLADLGPGFFDSAFGHVFLGIGKHILAVAAELGFLSFDLSPDLGLLGGWELEEVEEDEDWLAVSLHLDEDGPLGEGSELVAPGLNELEGGEGGVGCSELLDDGKLLNLFWLLIFFAFFIRLQSLFFFFILLDVGDCLVDKFCNFIF